MDAPMRSDRRKAFALGLLATAQFVMILDAGIVNIALPSIGGELDFAPEHLAWVSNAYTVVFGGLLLLGGRCSDLVGPRRMFIIGMAVLAAASLAGGLATSDVWLIAARAGQGMGAALVSPAALTLVMITFAEGAERNKALGVFMSMSGLGGASGFFFGGVLTDWLGWQSVFFVNVPIAVLAALLAPRLLDDARPGSRSGSFDAAGAVSVTAGLALLVYAILDADRSGWGSARTLTALAVSVALLAAFVAAEARGSNPLVPLSIFRNGMLRNANALAVLLTMAVFPFFFFLTLYLQQVKGFTPFEAGFGQLPVALAMTVAAAGLAAKLVSRFGPAAVLAGGLGVIAAGLAWFSRISVAGGYWTGVVGPCVLVGVGAGCTFVAVTVAATSTARPHEAGLASGLINTTQQIGGALGLAVLVAVSGAVTGSAAAPSRAQLVDGYQAAMLTGALIAAAAALLTLALLRRPTPEPAAAAPPAAETADLNRP